MLVEVLGRDGLDGGELVDAGIVHDRINAAIGLHCVFNDRGGTCRIGNTCEVCDSLATRRDDE